MNSKKSGMSLVAKQRAAGWIFLAPATIMIAVMSFYPMIRAFIISLQTGAGANMRFADPIFSNYKRIMMDKVFQQSIVNTFLYLIIQVPIMLVLAILLAQLLNNKDLKFKGFFRTCVFLPCATSLVSYSLIFRSMFATDGLINSIALPACGKPAFPSFHRECRGRWSNGNQANGVQFTQRQPVTLSPIFTLIALLYFLTTRILEGLPDFPCDVPDTARDGCRAASARANTI